MEMIPKKILCLALIFFVLGVLSRCASVEMSENDASFNPQTSDKISFPEYQGPKSRVQVIRFVIPTDVANKYPELLEKRVGWGLCNRIVDSFYETERFIFIEEKEEMLKRLVDNWKLTQAGIYTSDEEIEPGSLKAPEYFIYGEVFDFAVSKRERVMGTRKREMLFTRIGVQIRLVNARTGEYAPGSGIGESWTESSGSVWARTRLEFDQSTVGEATQRAVNLAILKLLERMKKE